MSKRRTSEVQGHDPPREQVSKRSKSKDITKGIDKKPVKTPKQQYRIVKIGLQSVVKDPEFIRKIHDSVVNLHKLAVHIYQFIALYQTHFLSKCQAPPRVDEELIRDIQRLIIQASDPNIERVTPKNRKMYKHPEDATLGDVQKKIDSYVTRLIQREHLAEFLSQQYRPLMVLSDAEQINDKSMGQSINYLATEVITALENNIREHYEDYLFRFCQAVYKPYKTTKKELNSASYFARRTIMNCDYDFQEDDPMLEYLECVVPSREIYKDSIYKEFEEDLTAEQKMEFDCQHYIPCMYFMNSFLEKNECKSFSLFPMRTAAIPKAIRIDTSMLLSSRFLTEELAEFMVEMLGKNTLKQLRASQTEAEKRFIWDQFFKTDMHCFSLKTEPNTDSRNVCHYRFDYSILTDGVSCSIQQTIPKNDPIYFPVTKVSKSRGKYIHDETDMKSISKMRIVGCDPGKQDLLYFASPNDREIDPNLDQKRQMLKTVDRFRYSQAQRKFECKTKYFSSLREQGKRNQGKIDGKTIHEWEHSLSFVSKKTTDFDKLRVYIQKKNFVNSKISMFWAKEEFRRLKWEAKRLKQISETKMMKAFERKFGGPNDVLIALGNWSQFKPRPGTEPTKNKSFRTLFKNHGYKYYMVDEFHTSKCCYKCHQEVEQHFLQVKNPKLYEKKHKEPRQNVNKGKHDISNLSKRQRRKKRQQKVRAALRSKPVFTETEENGPCVCEDCKAIPEEKRKQKTDPTETVKCHGLTHCKNRACNTFWNRDLNGALNIGRIAWSLINDRGYPAYLSRTNSNGEEILETEEDQETPPEEEESMILVRDNQNPSIT